MHWNISGTWEAHHFTILTWLELHMLLQRTKISPWILSKNIKSSHVDTTTLREAFQTNILTCTHIYSVSKKIAYIQQFQLLTQTRDLHCIRAFYPVFGGEIRLTLPQHVEHDLSQWACYSFLFAQNLVPLSANTKAKPIDTRYSTNSLLTYA